MLGEDFRASTGSRFCRWNTAAGIEALVSYGVGHGVPVVKGDEVYAFALEGS